MSSRYIEVKTIQHGQPRAYADHEYIYELTFTQDDWHTNVGPDAPKIPAYRGRDGAMAYARAACPWIDKEDPDYNWASRTFVSLEPCPPTPHGNPTLGPVTEGYSDRWRIHVRAAFTD